MLSSFVRGWMRNGEGEHTGGGGDGQTAEDRDGRAARARARQSRRLEMHLLDARSTRAVRVPRASRGASWLATGIALDLDALLFADRGSRTDTVGGCVNSGPAKGL